MLSALLRLMPGVRLTDQHQDMTNELTLFCGITVVFALFQMRHAHSIDQARTPYQAADRLSWLLGAILSIGVALWRPWFTETYIKAGLSAALLLPFFASIGLNGLASFYQVRQDEDGVSRWSRRFASVFILGLILLAFRACG